MKKRIIIVTAIAVLMALLFLLGSKIMNKPNQISEIDKDFSELFELKLFTDKDSYKETDKIRVWATLKYIGSNDNVTIWHGLPSINFMISDGKEFTTGGLVQTVLKSTTLKKNVTYTFEYEKNGVIDEKAPNAEFLKKFYSEKDLYLPNGAYEVKATTGFSLTEKMDKRKGLESTLKISVGK